MNEALEFIANVDPLAKALVIGWAVLILIATTWPWYNDTEE